jgi:hypothetical protein
MKKQLFPFYLSLFLMLICNSNCKQNKIVDTIKMSTNDPFKSTMTESQYFTVNGNQDNVIEGEKGTIIIMPKGCFKDEKGDVIASNIKIELTEALAQSDMLLSNLNTTSNGKLLETDGMIYFNATANGKQLEINADNPIQIQMPTEKKKPNMKAYSGTRDEKGNMNWSEPQLIINYLNIVDLKSLDFLPVDFQSIVERNMPYKTYSIATQSLVDSLYYSFSSNGNNDLMDKYHSEITQYNEPYYNQNKEVINGKYTAKSYEIHGAENKLDSITEKEDKKECGIDPAIIKVIKSEKYQNTLIATREFETRLQTIFKTCRNSILELYINNLDKNLYEIDELAAKTLGLEDANATREFTRFAEQRLTKVKDADKYAQLLRGYYQTQLTKIKAELEAKQLPFKKALLKEKKERDKIVKEYAKLLWKREKYRMETYGFEWTKTGWINIDNGDLPKTWDAQPLEVNISNGLQLDRVYTYVVYASIKSLYRLNAYNNEHFYVGNQEDREMLMPKKAQGYIVGIGYKGETPWLATKEFVTGTEPKMTLDLKASTLKDVKLAIAEFEKYKKENRINEDLKYMEKLYKNQQKNRINEREYWLLRELLVCIEPCCWKSFSPE